MEGIGKITIGKVYDYKGSPYYSFSVFERQALRPKIEKVVPKVATCFWCNMILNGAYVYIIEKLKEEGLIPKDYIMMCCDCKLEHNLY